MGAGTSHALDGRPTPVSPLWMLRGMKLEVLCRACKRSMDLPVDEVLRRGAGRREVVYEFAKRLRCEPPAGCGARDASIRGVKGWR